MFIKTSVLCLCPEHKRYSVHLHPCIIRPSTHTHGQMEGISITDSPFSSSSQKTDEMCLWLKKKMGS